MFINRRAINKRKGVIKTLVRVVLLVLILTIVIGGATYYIIFIKMRQRSYMSPLPQRSDTHTVPKVDPGIADLTKQLTEKKIDFTTISASNGSYIVFLSNNSQVTIAAHKDTVSQISSLQFILSRLTMEGRQFNKLDLRFDKPIIVFK